MGQQCCSPLEPHSTNPELTFNAAINDLKLLEKQIFGSQENIQKKSVQHITHIPIEKQTAPKEQPSNHNKKPQLLTACSGKTPTKKNQSKDATMDMQYKNLVIIWIDKNVHSNQNSKTLRTFKNHGLEVIDVSSISSLKAQLKDLIPNDIVLVITAASLEKQDYQFMQKDERIKEITLFCLNEERARLLMSQQNQLTKIRSVGFYASEVLENVQSIQQQLAQERLINPETVIQLNF